jgi:hypothetical protein
MKLQHGPKNLDHDRRLKFSCVDLYMLQMQSKHIASLLDAFSSFRERLFLLTRESPAALFWIVGDPSWWSAAWCRLCAYHGPHPRPRHGRPASAAASAQPMARLCPPGGRHRARHRRLWAVCAARADAATPSIRSLLLQTSGCRASTTFASRKAAAPRPGARAERSENPRPPQPADAADRLGTYAIPYSAFGALER